MKNLFIFGRLSFIVFLSGCGKFTEPPVKSANEIEKVCPGVSDIFCYKGVQLSEGVNIIGADTVILLISN